jgi:hypothetical protein
VPELKASARELKIVEVVHEVDQDHDREEGDGGIVRVIEYDSEERSVLTLDNFWVQFCAERGGDRAKQAPDFFSKCSLTIPRRPEQMASYKDNKDVVNEEDEDCNYYLKMLDATAVIMQ